MKKFIIYTMIFSMFMSFITVHGDSPEITAPSAILIDAGTGKVLYEKNSDIYVYLNICTKYFFKGWIYQGSNYFSSRNRRSI